MKILHVSTSTSGGAGIAATRIHLGMIANGMDSNILTLNHSQKAIPNHYVYDGSVKREKPDYPILSFKNWLQEKLLKKYHKEVISYNNQLKEKTKYKTPSIEEGKNSFELFSFPDSIYDITETEIYKKSDIIHLHWVADFLDYESFFSKNTKPIVWTLHDENPYLGGFHYEGDLIRNKETHSVINEIIRLNKVKWIQSSKCKMTVVSPSYWLADKARQSDVFKGKEVLTIRNGLDFTIFKHRDKSFCRDVFNLPNDKRIFLLASADLKNYRKGTDLVLPIINSEDFKNDLFVFAGSNFKDFDYKNVVSLGSIQDELLMSLIYSAVDAFILPSREDNLPNTMLEAIACGTPVIAFDIGDNREFINVMGKVLQNKEVLKKGVLYFNSLDFNLNYLREDFEIKNIVNQYIACYKK